MPRHYLDTTYQELVNPIADQASNTLSFIERGESLYQRLLLIKQGRTDQEVASQLFSVEFSQVTAEHLAIVTDITNAALVFHQLYQMMNNVAVAQADRMDDLRKFAF